MTRQFILECVIDLPPDADAFAPLGNITDKVRESWNALLEALKSSEKAFRQRAEIVDVRPKTVEPSAKRLGRPPKSKASNGPAPRFPVISGPDPVA